MVELKSVDVNAPRVLHYGRPPAPPTVELADIARLIAYLTLVPFLIVGVILTAAVCIYLVQKAFMSL